MAGLDITIVREYFELNGFLVRQLRKYNLQKRKTTSRKSEEEIDVVCFVMERFVDGYEVIVGMNVFTRIGGVLVSGRGVRFQRRVAAAAAVEEVVVEDTDFEARFDGEKWTVGWKWRGEAPVLTNRVAKYAMTAAVEDKFNEKVEDWIAQGWLRPCAIQSSTF